MPVPSDDATRDLRSSEQSARDLERELLRYQTFIQLTHESFFEYDLESRLMRVFGDSETARKYAFIFQNRPLSPQNLNRFMDVFRASRDGVDADFLLDDENEQSHWYHIAARGVREDGHLVRVVGTFRDIQAQKDTEEKRVAYEARLREKAVYDGVTRLLNRAATEDLVDLRLSNSSDRCVCLLVDIDDFKEINDTQGHVFGDLVLREVAAVLRSCCRPYDVSGRIGGDEFFVMFCGVPDDFFAEGRLKEILRRVSALTEKLESRRPVSVSIGVTSVLPDDRQFVSVYARADKALYLAKAQGKNTACRAPGC